MTCLDREFFSLSVRRYTKKKFQVGFYLMTK